jgi:hypothetical protein
MEAVHNLAPRRSFNDPKEERAMMTLFLATLLALDDQTSVTFYAIRATQEESASVPATLREIETELRELAPYNRFEVVGSAQVKHGQNGDRVALGFPIRDAGRHTVHYTPSQPMNGVVAFKNLTVVEHALVETVTLTGTGLSQKTQTRATETIFQTTVDVAEGRLTLIGTITVETKGGPVTILVAVKATATP